MHVEATFRARCHRCGVRFRWRGTMMDMPPCPGCGQSLSAADRQRGQRQLEAAARQDALDRLTRTPPGSRVADD